MTRRPGARAAVFLDRDGVINLPVPDGMSGLHESPYCPGDVRLVPGAAEALRVLRSTGAALVIVSNQPAAAKGTATVADLDAVHEEVMAQLHAAGADVDLALYCRHHPDGIDPRLGRACECRKPNPGLLIEAACCLSDIDLGASWLIGDSDVDVGAAHAVGAQAVLLAEPLSAHRRTGSANPERHEPSVLSAAQFVARELGRQSRPEVR